MGNHTPSSYVSQRIKRGIAVAITFAVVVIFFHPFSLPRASNSLPLLSHRDTAKTLRAVKTMSIPDGAKMVFFNLPDSPGGNAVDCDAVYPVPRAVVESDQAGQQIELLLSLFAGPSEQESHMGFSSPFSDVTTGILSGVSFKDGVVEVDLNDIRSLASTDMDASCTARAIKASIDATLYQFKEVERVELSINGDKAAFYMWAGLPCETSDIACGGEPEEGVTGDSRR